MIYLANKHIEKATVVAFSICESRLKPAVTFVPALF